MRVVDLAGQLLIQYKNYPTAFGYIESRDGKRFYISTGQGGRHILPTPQPDAQVAKVVMEVK